MQDMNSSLCLKLLENNTSFIVIIDEGQSIYWLNQSFCDFLGLDREQLIGKAAADVKEPCLKQALNAKVRVELFAGTLDKWIELQDIMIIRGSLTDQEAEQELTVCYYSDASHKVQTEKQLVQLESTLTHKMSHDPITGMLNNYSMFQTLNSEVSRSRRYNNPLSLILMNVEYQSDSEVIVEEKQEQMRLMISQLLKDQMRWADIVGHLEDFDFVLLLPETDLESAEVLVKKLKSSIHNVALDTIHVTYGISQWQKGDDVRLFLERAVKGLGIGSV
ncbi:MAG: diguanylate cyclase [Gammaproteobacteria bacterium]|nr:diguanylate cyclase [Gammaproteobacteria bacterium]